MNLWRVPIEEKSGKVLGPPEPITAPSPDSAQISIAADGRRIAYVERLATRNLQKIRFDAFKECTVGEPTWITQGSRLAVSPDVSPDGEWLAFSSFGPQEDIFVIKTDGTGLRQLTDDYERDRYPRWSPDGKQIAFYSLRSGKYEIWAINRDGSGLQQRTFTPDKPAGALSPAWSPDGTRLSYFIFHENSYTLEVGKSWRDQTPQALPPPSVPDEKFMAWSWSPDGQKVAGPLMRPEGVSSGIAIYSFDSKKYEKVTDFGLFPIWLKDGRRLIFCFKEKLYLLDSRSKKFHEIMYAPLSARTGEMLGVTSLSPDERTLYFAEGTIEADIWMLTLE